MIRKSFAMLLAGLLLVGFGALTLAQEGGAKPEAGKPAAKAGKRMTRIEQALSAITLTEEQKGKIDPIVAEYKEKTKAAKDIAERKKLHDETVAQILSLLTDEQKPKFEEALKPKARGGKKAGAEPAKPEEKKEGEAPK